MTITYLVLSKPLNIHGLMFPAGPRLSIDDAWTRLLMECGAEVITEEQFDNLAATARAVLPEPLEPPEKEVPVSGAHDADDGRRDKSPTADTSKQHRPRRYTRRVP